MGLFGKKANKKFNELDIALLKLQNECDRRNTQAEQASARASEFHKKAIQSLKDHNTDLAKMYLCLEKEAKKYSSLLSVTCVEAARQKRLLQERVSQISLVDAMKKTNELLNKMQIDGEKLKETMDEIQQHVAADKASINEIDQIISGNKDEVDNMMAELMDEITIERDINAIPSHNPVLTDTSVHHSAAIGTVRDKNEDRPDSVEIEEDREVEVCVN
ncbi:Hypothetical protein DHA2_10299 [Giardia duodenalis]|uniref:Uncharacterized protein n=1 Tax=Giardia intestinalis TaxID=5741 RepID=V6THG5_GIAIN|nr:Hypothetical protein DHA2_10299 [Giardia intestinalis]